RARPDLATPSPSTLRSLAARASSRSSLERALARADALTLHVLEAVLALEPLTDPPGGSPADPPAADRAEAPLPRIDAAVVARALGVPADGRPRVEAAVRAAVEHALLWDAGPRPRSEERRVGKEWRSRGGPVHEGRNGRDETSAG